MSHKNNLILQEIFKQRRSLLCGNELKDSEAAWQDSDFTPIFLKL